MGINLHRQMDRKTDGRMDGWTDAVNFFHVSDCKTCYKSPNTNCSLARAQTTLVQWNPSILGIAGKLLSLQERLTRCIGASR